MKKVSDKNTLDKENLEIFDNLNLDWWNYDGKMKLLHSFTPIRIEYILKTLNSKNLINSSDNCSSRILENINILDVGCGGGLLCEPMARLGGTVTGIDASKTSINVAKTHAKESSLNISYICSKVETFSKLKKNYSKYNLICISEVLEHVLNRRYFISCIKKLLSKNGVVVVTTINKNIFSLLFLKFFAEKVFKFIPDGTHEYEKFIKPELLQREFYENDILIDDISGFVPSFNGGFKISSVTTINYAASGSLIK